MPGKQPSPEDFRRLSDALEPVLQAAGAAILEIYAHPEHVVRTKPDASPVTDADLASHDLIVAALARLTPDWPVVSEEDLEHQAISPAQISNDTPFWLLDPLDGTKEFIARTGEFSINLGLVLDRAPIFGLLYGPVAGDLYRGGLGLSAQVKTQAQGKPQQSDWQTISCRVRPTSGGVLIASRRSTSFPQDMQFERKDALGSALKFGRLAQGQADYYLRRGPTMEWDTCAGQAILESAGGHIALINGEPLRYGKPDWRNTGFIAQGKIA